MDLRNRLKIWTAFVTGMLILAAAPARAEVTCSLVIGDGSGHVQAGWATNVVIYNDHEDLAITLYRLREGTLDSQRDLGLSTGRWNRAVDQYYGDEAGTIFSYYATLSDTVGRTLCTTDTATVLVDPNTLCPDPMPSCGRGRPLCVWDEDQGLIWICQ